MGLKDDEMAWADYLITRAGLLVFTSILLLAAFKVPPLFILQDAAGEMDADLSSMTSFMEVVAGSSLQGARYYHFDNPGEVTISMTARFVAAEYGVGIGGVTRARALMTTVYPANSLWVDRPGMMEEIANRCEGRTGIGDDLLLDSDMASVKGMLGEVEAELAQEPFVPDTRQMLVVEKVILYYEGTDGIERRGITIVHQ
ncbi:MAG: hypothetical protein KAR85_06360 [Methanosarcinales archaeon]|nr:hypothetical protein [Methanosarcinales archaeon]